MGFIRVRAAEGPAHEFDVSEKTYASNPGVYVVVDKKPVRESRPVAYKSGLAKPAAKQKEA